MSDIVAETCRRFPSAGQSGKTARIERLIQSGAWTDAALALIDLELPQWQIRRIAYDEGEWHCALSRQRELPDWLDQSIEARHCGSGAGDAERVRRGPAHHRAGEPDQRSQRRAADANPLYEPVSATISLKAAPIRTLQSPSFSMTANVKICASCRTARFYGYWLL